MSSQPGSSKTGPLFLAAILIFTLLTLLYLTTLGDYSESLDYVEGSVRSSAPEPKQSINELLMVKVDPSLALVSENVKKNVSSVIASKHTMFRHQRIIIVGMIITVVLVAVAAALLIFYQSGIISDCNAEVNSKEEQLSEEQAQPGEEGLEAEMKSGFYLNLVIGSMIINVIAAVIYILVMRMSGAVMSFSAMVPMLLLSVCAFQGIFLLLLAVCGSIFNLCRLFMNSSNPNVKRTAWFIARLAIKVASACAYLCLPFFNLVARRAGYSHGPMLLRLGTLNVCLDIVPRSASHNLEKFVWSYATTRMA